MAFNSTKSPGDLIQSADWNTFVDFTEIVSSNATLYYAASSNYSSHKGDTTIHFTKESLDDDYPGSSNINRSLLDTISGNLDDKIDALGGTFDHTLYIISSNAIERFADSANINIKITNKQDVLTGGEYYPSSLGKSLELFSSNALSLYWPSSIGKIASGNINSIIDFSSNSISLYYPSTLGKLVSGVADISLTFMNNSGLKYTTNYNWYNTSGLLFGELAVSGIKYTNNYSWYNASANSFDSILNSGNEYTSSYDWFTASSSKLGDLAASANKYSTFYASSLNTYGTISAQTISGGIIYSNSLTNLYPSSLGKIASGNIESLILFSSNTQSLYFPSSLGKPLIDFSSNALLLYANSSNISLRFPGSSLTWISVSAQNISGQWTTPIYNDSRPTADTTNEGNIIRMSGSGTEKTYIYISVRNSAGSYEWIQLAVST